MNNLPNYDNFPDYTRTISVVTNITIDYPTIYEHLDITPYTVIAKKRGRKRKTEPNDPNKNIPDGSIISVKYRDKNRKIHYRGANLKAGNPTCFHNNLCMVVKLGKLLDIKISQNGKFHFTGCQSEQQAEKCVILIYRKFEAIQKMFPDKPIMAFPPNENMTAIFNSVLINKVFSLGFNIKRSKLDQFLNTQTEDFVSVIDPDGNYAGIVVLLPTERPVNVKLNQLRYDPENNRWIRSKASWTRFLEMLPKRDKTKIMKKESSKNHTFLVFWNGQVILSSPFDYHRKEAFDHFVNTLSENKSYFEKVDDPVSSPSVDASEIPTRIVF